jgi:hypothetical protein
MFFGINDSESDIILFGGVCRESYRKSSKFGPAIQGDVKQGTRIGGPDRSSGECGGPHTLTI